MPTSRLNLRRLKKEVAATPPRTKALRPGGRPATGLMDAVRENLDAILEIKAGTTWGAIAAALTAQRFTTADGREITARNVTGIVSSIRRQAKRKAAQAAERAQRHDLHREVWDERPLPDFATTGAASSQSGRHSVRHRLAPELQGGPPAQPGTDGGPIREDEIRRLQAEKHKHLLKRD